MQSRRKGIRAEWRGPGKTSDVFANTDRTIWEQNKGDGQDTAESQGEDKAERNHREPDQRRHRKAKSSRRSPARSVVAQITTTHFLATESHARHGPTPSA
jgi:hypothetical protein